MFRRTPLREGSRRRPAPDKWSTPILARRLRALVVLGVLLCLTQPAPSPVGADSPQAVSWPVNLLGGPPGLGSTWRLIPDGGTDNGTPDLGDCDNIPPANFGVLLEDASINNSSPKYAFDQAGLWINNRVFTSTTALVTGTQALAAGPMILASGLQVNLEYYAASQTATLRTLASFYNPTASSLIVTPTLAVNLRLNSSVFAATSDGDASLGFADRWAVSSDDAGTNAAATTTVLRGPQMPGAELNYVDDVVFACPGNENAGILAEFQLTVPAGQTRRLMFFNQLNENSPAALTAVAAFNTNPAPGSDLVAGLSTAQLMEIVNWDFTPRVYLPMIRR